MNKQTIFLLLLLPITSLLFAQTSRSVSAGHNSQTRPINKRANIRPNEQSQLRRYDPPMQSTEQNYGADKLDIIFEKGISPSTRQAIIRYVTQHYSITQLTIAIYKLSDTNNLYFVIGTVSRNQQSQDSDRNIFLILSGQEGTVSEVNKAENDVTCGIKVPVFFLGQNKIFIVVSIMAFDGAFCGNYAFEYADNSLKSLGEIKVYDGKHGRGAWQGHNPMERATAGYKNNTYFVTMRGEGSLYVPAKDSLSSGDNDKKLAPPSSPVTFFYDGVTWRTLTPGSRRELNSSAVVSISPQLPKGGIDLDPNLFSDAERISWVEMRTGQRLPKNAIVGGIELNGVNDGVTLYVCRANYNGGLHPGKLISGYCNIGYGGREIVFTEYQVATGSGFWGRPKPEYSGALLGGAEPGRNLYVCRAHFRESRGSQIIDHGQHPGKIVEGRCNFGFGTRELSSDDFEVFYPSSDNGRILGKSPTDSVGGYIDVIERNASSCEIRIIAGEKLYSGVISFARLSAITGQRINRYEDAVAILNGRYVNVNLLSVAPSSSNISSINFGDITQITFPPGDQSKQAAQIWNERRTATETIIDLSADILFDFNKATIRQDAIPTLIRLARLIRQSRSGAIQLNGFTDSIGSDEYNMGLSERRADAVKQWLVSKGGVEADRLQTKGYGESKPAVPNTNPDGSDNPAGRQKNRRVEVRVPRS